MIPPAFIDTGSDDGAYAEALLFGSLRPVGPDTFANFTQDPSARHSDSDDLAGPAVILSHEMLNSAEVQQNPDAR